MRKYRLFVQGEEVNSLSDSHIVEGDTPLDAYATWVELRKGEYNEGDVEDKAALEEELIAAKCNWEYRDAVEGVISLQPMREEGVFHTIYIVELA